MNIQDVFSPIIGHKQQLSDLARVVAGTRTPHALLFAGPAGVGKQTIARDLAAALLSQTVIGEFDEKAFSVARGGNHPDLLWLRRDPEKKDISVESVRELISQLRLVPYSAPCKVAVINDAHEMNSAAANALLMTLEEPVPNTYLFLVTESSHRLPATIISRCQSLHFGKLSDAEVSKLLNQLLGDAAVTREVVSYCDGSISILGLDELADPRSLVIENNKTLTEHIAHRREQLGVTNKQIDAIVGEFKNSSGRTAQLLAIAADVAAEKEHIGTFWKLFQRAVNNQLRNASTESVALWAEAAQQIATSEYLVQERNVNPSLQLSSLLVTLSSIGQ